MSEAFLVGFLISLAIFLLFLAIWRMVPRRDPVEERLQEYGYIDIVAEEAAPDRPRLPLIRRLLAGFGLGPRLAEALSRADISLTAAEYTLIMLVAGILGFVVGALRTNPAGGLLLAVLFGALPIFYLRIAISRRRRVFTQQLPDVVTLLAGSLRAGSGLNQGLELLVDQMPDPARKEFGRVLNGVSLGISLPQALSNMARRVGSDDLDLIVMAIVVQYEAGGNLAAVLETIGHTVRERIRILREVRVLTAQQRLTGYILTAVPVFLALFLWLMQPGYFDPFFEPGLIRLLPVMGIAMVLIGFLLIQRIVSIRV